MKVWKVLMEFNGRVTEKIIEAKYYSEANNLAEILYPGSRIFSITPFR